jgi:hypothetical protein
VLPTKNKLSRKSSIFWGIMSCSSFETNLSFGRTCSLHLQGRRISQAIRVTCFMLISCLAYWSILQTKATYSTERSVCFQWITWRHVPTNKTLHNHRCENLKSYNCRWIRKYTTVTTTALRRSLSSVGWYHFTSINFGANKKCHHICGTVFSRHPPPLPPAN